jgi:hypothetical protein
MGLLASHISIAGVGNTNPMIMKIKGRCSQLTVTKCFNVVLMLDEISTACHVSESERVSIVVRGAFPSPIIVRSVQGLHFTAGHNNIHSSVSGAWLLH